MGKIDASSNNDPGPARQSNDGLGQPQDAAASAEERKALYAAENSEARA
jgi:hypothetical protein